MSFAEPQILIEGSKPVLGWTHGVPVEHQALDQLRNVAALPFVHHHVAVMPDVHWGIGATIGSVIATTTAIVPAAVGVDIGCGMVAAKTNLTAAMLPDNLASLRNSIEALVPVGKSFHSDAPPTASARMRGELDLRYQSIVVKHPGANSKGHPVLQLGTLGSGNHFIEVCLDESNAVWIMLHSGSRGIGNRIGTYFISKAREEMQRLDIHLPDRDLAYLEDGPLQTDYIEAVLWAQDYAAHNRAEMLAAVFRALELHCPGATYRGLVVDCHHNYVRREHHYDHNVWITRKGAVSARLGERGIIPGSMGTKSYIVEGKGNRASFNSCSHGAGRAMSRGEAKRRFSAADHAAATSGVECRKDPGVIDETPAAYKDIDAVIAAQSDLITVLHTLKQVLCVKG